MFNAFKHLKSCCPIFFDYLIFLVFIFVVALSIGCGGNVNESSSKSKPLRENPITGKQKINLDFLDSIELIDSNNPFKIWSYRLGKGTVISKEKLRQLKPFRVFNSNHRYELFGRINFSTSFKTIVFSDYDNERYSSLQLITYGSNDEVVDSLMVYQHDNLTSISSYETYVLKDKIFVEDTASDTAEEYEIDAQGKFIKNIRPVTFKHYRYLDKFKGSLYEMPQRIVKAKNGLIFRDSLNNRIGKLDFGETVYIVGYTNDTIAVNDDGKILKDVKAKIVIDPKAVQTGDNFYIEPSNIAYVFASFLFKNESENDDEEHYSYDGLSVGKSESSTIDLSEIFEVEEINFTKYRNRIVKRPEIEIPGAPIKKDGVLKIPFENGNVLTLRDTTYLSEYSPARHFNVSFHQDFKDAYVVGESMFFDEDTYTVLSKETGDTLHQFSGYPHLSPNGKYTVSVTHDFECIQATYLQLYKLNEQQKYDHYVGLSVSSWSYPFKVNSNDEIIEDLSIYWLSDDEFILKVKNPEDCDLGEVIKVFYLKYKIK